jgi:hypothetical protein
MAGGTLQPTKLVITHAFLADMYADSHSLPKPQVDKVR